MKSESDLKPIVPAKKGPSFGKKRLRQDLGDSADEDAAIETKRLKIESVPVVKATLTA